MVVFGVIKDSMQALGFLRLYVRSCSPDNPTIASLSILLGVIFHPLTQLQRAAPDYWNNMAKEKGSGYHQLQDEELLLDHGFLQVDLARIWERRFFTLLGVSIFSFLALGVSTFKRTCSPVMGGLEQPYCK